MVVLYVKAEVLEEFCFPNKKIQNSRHLNGSEVPNYGQVILTKQAGYSSNLDCTLQLRAPPDYELQVRVTYVNILKQGDKQQDRCYPDWLRIDSGNHPGIKSTDSSHYYLLRKRTAEVQLLYKYNITIGLDMPDKAYKYNITIDLGIPNKANKNSIT